MRLDSERIAGMTDKELASLDANAACLETSGTAIQRAEAVRLRPMINEETAKRRVVHIEQRVAAGAKRASNFKRKKSDA